MFSCEELVFISALWDGCDDGVIGGSVAAGWIVDVVAFGLAGSGGDGNSSEFNDQSAYYTTRMYDFLTNSFTFLKISNRTSDLCTF